jgi:hypothetical protein
MYKVASTVLMQCAGNELRILGVIHIFGHILAYLTFRYFKKKNPLGLICALCVSLWLGVIHLKDSID